VRPLRIAQITTFYPPANFGGDGVFVERLSRLLAREGHDVHVIHAPDSYELLSGQRSAPPAAVPGLTVHALRDPLGRAGQVLAHQLGRPVGTRAQLATLLAEPFDVLNFHNVSLLGGPDVLRYGTGPKLLSLHDYWLVCETHILYRMGREACRERTCLRCTLAARRPPQLWRRTPVLKRALAHVDEVLVPSETSRRLHAANGLPVPTRVMPLFRPRPRPPLPGGAPRTFAPRPYFLCAGRLEPLKGVEELVDRFRAYREADLVIAGSGSLFEPLSRAIRDLPHVHLTGWLDEDELYEAHAGALAAVSPSRAWETFGLAPLDAFAAGVPAIVPPGGALEELVASTGGGLVYQDLTGLLAAMESIRADAELRRNLGESGRAAWNREYSEGPFLDAYYALIDEVKARRRA